MQIAMYVNGDVTKKMRLWLKRSVTPTVYEIIQAFKF